MPLEGSSAQDRYLEVLERVLDKGIVIDASVRISVVGMELVRIDAWVVIASLETYLSHSDLISKIPAASQGPSAGMSREETPPLVS